jgi:copper homeostasis protein
MAEVSVEVCASTLRDVAVAMEAGADRVELCSVWSVGGITPNVVVVESAAAMGMPARALIRPREGHFVFSASERTWSVEEAKVMMDCGAERVVVGALTADGRLDEAYLEAMCDAVGPEALVWHRAIDVSVDPDADVQTLLRAGVTSLLSSGGCARAVEGAARLKAWADMGMAVVAGGGVRAADVAELARVGVEAVHASCRTTVREEGSPLFDSATHPVDFELVDALVTSAEKATNA